MVRAGRRTAAMSRSRTARSSKSANCPAPPKQTVDAGGQVVAPGFIDNHCHYDAQVTWDPLCSFSCDHGATSVVFGNCSLSLAPVKKDRASQRRLSEFLSYVEAIPMEVLDTLEFTWETFPAISRRDSTAISGSMSAISSAIPPSATT